MIQPVSPVPAGQPQYCRSARTRVTPTRSEGGRRFPGRAASPYRPGLAWWSGIC